jgi:mRNA interferase HigB
VRVFSRSTINRFAVAHPDAREALRLWFHVAKAAAWKGPADIKKQYPKASIVNRERVVFDIAGNKYRLIAAIKYQGQAVFIRFIGTHAEYDKVDAATV